MEAPPLHMPARYRLYDLAFRVLSKTGIDRAFNSIDGARGIIFTLHHVRPNSRHDFDPNRALIIKPQFLDVLIKHVKSKGFEFISLDEAIQNESSCRQKPFAVLTFDDGYCDFDTFARPILEHHAVPATLFITAGFADRIVTPWWSALEEVIRHESSVSLASLGRPIGFPTDTSARKSLAFTKIKKIFLGLNQQAIATVVSDLCFNCGIPEKTLIDKICLTWDQIRTLSNHPLFTIGAHTISHPYFANEDAHQVLSEIARSREIIENHIDKSVRHFAYPSAGKSAIGSREFSMTKVLGFTSALTTRPGLIYTRTLLCPTALPRVSLNGYFQNLQVIDTLLSGIPFLLQNRGMKAKSPKIGFGKYRLT
jgi:peptidoglycan/xylan/chitin deacetylase (PgdA/CDA1 family)